MSKDDACRLERTMAGMLGVENGELPNVGISRFSSIIHAYLNSDAVSKLPPNPDLRNRQWSYSTKLSRVCSVSLFRYPQLKLYHLRLPRQLNGRFKDKDVADVLQQATTRSACGFGYRQVPFCAQDHELQKIKEARDSNVRSLNDYRKCLGLKRTSYASWLRVFSFFFPDIIAHKTFIDWNSNIEIAKHAEKLYKNIDDLELYVSSFIV